MKARDRAPDKRRGALAGQPEPLGTAAAQALTKAKQGQDTAQDRQRPLALLAEVRVVQGRDRMRLELFVRCPKAGCRGLHQHRAALSFMQGVRRAPCGARYTVVSGVPLEAAA